MKTFFVVSQSLLCSLIRPQRGRGRLLGGAQRTLLARPEQAEALAARRRIVAEEFLELGDVDLAVGDRLGDQLLKLRASSVLQVGRRARDLVDVVAHSVIPH